MLWSISVPNKIWDSELQYLHCNPRASFGQLIANKIDNVMTVEHNEKFYPLPFTGQTLLTHNFWHMMIPLNHFQNMSEPKVVTEQKTHTWIISPGQ
jgi:hypothetical protein